MMAEIRWELVMVELRRGLGMMKNPVSKRRLGRLGVAKRKRLQYHEQQLQLMSSQVTDGTDVAETPVVEEKPIETETKTNPVVIDMKNPDSMK
jgi:hypothetical protein